MKKSIVISTSFCSLLLSVMFFSGCGHSTNEVARIIAERDSLKLATERQERRLSNMDKTLDIINSGLDSIAKSEDSLFIDNKSEGASSREDAKRKVEDLAKLVDSQRQRIADLEKQLQEAEIQDGPDKNLQQVIERFKYQLAEKDREIASLKQQLEQSNISLAQLRNQVGSQAKTIVELDRRNASQNEALRRQDAMLNHCYVKIGDKKTLEQLGIVKKGKIVAQGALDRSKFSRVDIRSFTELEFEARHPRILTSMPSSAYELTTNGKNHYVLRITNPSEFWRISNYLVIQTN